MASFVEFPIFRKLTIADKKNYENIYRMFEPYADLSFSNLIVWFSIVEDVEISEHPNGNIILRYRNPLDYNTPCYTFLGNGNCSETINSIINLQDQLNVDAGLSMVPSAVARELILSKEINDYTFIAVLS